MKRIDLIKKVYEDYNLDKDEDIFKLHGTAVITKTGAQKIIAQEKYTYDFEVVRCEPDYCAVKCRLLKAGEVLAVSYGSAEKANVKNSQKYYLEMAEKRAKVRAVLMAIGAHGYIYGDDEADDFQKPTP